jgi:rod shape-determining protein MreD
MILELISYLLRFAVIILLQLFVVNNIELSSMVNPYIYVVFVLLLPLNTKPWHTVLIAFLTGAVMDAFSSTPGLHIAATNLMGFLRIHYLKAVTTKEDQQGNIIPSISQKGIVWFVLYGFIMIFIHHLFLFYLEIYSLREFFATLLRVFLSTLVSLLLIIIGQLLFYNVRKRNE